VVAAAAQAVAAAALARVRDYGLFDSIYTLTQ
jgi:hypothetical protein